MEFIRFLKKMTFLLPVVLVMAAFNYFVDPACLYKGQRFYKDVAAIMLKGENVANLVNFDDRSLYKWYIGGLQKRKEILAFGSSRVLQVDSSMFPGYSFFNNGVIAGCSLEDHLALYWMYRKKSLVPSYVIFELDPWLLSANAGSPRFNSIADDYRDIMIHLYGRVDKGDLKRSSLRDDLKRFRELISPSYFQSSFWSWFYSSSENKLKGVQYYPTSDLLSAEKIKRADGSIGYEGIYRKSGTAEARTKAMAADWPYSTKLDPVRKDELEKLIGLMQKDNVKIVFFLAPFNPIAYRIFNEPRMDNIFTKVDGYFRELARRKNIKVFGSFDPAADGLKESDFYDGGHAKEYVIKRYFAPGMKIFN